MTTNDTTPVTTPTQETQAPKPITIADPNLSFSDYEKLRRGEKIETDAPTLSALEGEKSSEQKKSKDSETLETDGKESDESDGEASEKETESKDDVDQTEDKPKKKSGFQRRIDKLNSQKAELAKEAEFWKRRALDGASESKSEPTQVDSKAKPVAADGKPKADDFETHAEYVEALTDWKVEQKQKELTQKQEQSRLESEQASKVKTYLERKEAFKDAHPDFDEVISDVEIPLPPVVSQIILESENGPALAYELAKNEKELERICKLGPIAAAREMGKIESRITAKPSEAKQEPKKITQAPKPLEPVGGGKAPASKKTPEEMTFAEYEQYRRDQMKRRRG